MRVGRNDDFLDGQEAARTLGRAVEEGLRARIAELEGKLAEHAALISRLMRVLSSHAGAIGSDAATSRYYSELADECARVLDRETPSAQALTRLVDAVGAVVRNGGYLSPGSGAMRDLEQRYSDVCDARSGRGEGEA